MASGERRARLPAGPAASILAVVALAVAAVLWQAGAAEVVSTPQGLRVDGRPFLPVGIYWAPLAKFEKLREMGFNVVHLWASNEETTRRELDEAHRLGMRAVIELSDFARANRPLASTLQPFVEALRTHPVVLTWYFIDEPGSQALARIRDGYRLLRAVDPAHPVLIVHFSPETAETIAPHVDILGVDWYPVPDQPVSILLNQLTRSRIAAGTQKPRWAVVQAFNKEVGGRPTRYPTPDEVRNMTYQSIVAGATGILYFSYAWQGILEQRDPTLWAALGPINRELAVLAPVLLEGVRPEGRIRVHTLGDVRTIVREWSGQTHVIVVNVGTTAARVEVYRRAGGRGRVESLFDARTWEMRDGVFTDTIEPYGVRTYRL